MNIINTVGELIEYLSQFSADTKVTHDNLKLAVDYDESTNTVDIH